MRRLLGERQREDTGSCFLKLNLVARKLASVLGRFSHVQSGV